MLLDALKSLNNTIKNKQTTINKPFNFKININLVPVKNFSLVKNYLSILNPTQISPKDKKHKLINLKAKEILLIKLLLENYNLIELRLTGYIKNNQTPKNIKVLDR
jgi:hypothetical protein